MINIFKRLFQKTVPVLPGQVWGTKSDDPYADEWQAEVIEINGNWVLYKSFLAERCQPKRKELWARPMMHHTELSQFRMTYRTLVKEQTL